MADSILNLDDFRTALEPVQFKRGRVVPVVAIDGVTQALVREADKRRAAGDVDWELKLREAARRVAPSASEEEIMALEERQVLALLHYCGGRSIEALTLLLGNGSSAGTDPAVTAPAPRDTGRSNRRKGQRSNS